MSIPILTTKFYIPSLTSRIIPRLRLIEQLNEGLHHKLTLVSAPAGFGKTTLVSEWLGQSSSPVAWLSLDEGDNDPNRFLTYFVAALQQVDLEMGLTIQSFLQAPQLPATEVLMTTLINDLTKIAARFFLVLDDYHLIESQPIQDALTFLLNHQPPSMHLVITTRADPPLPLARLRARGEMTELREDGLRFTIEEATAFLNNVMSLKLSAEEVAKLEARTEGWIAGLQLAALSMQRQKDLAGFISAFAGDDQYIVDYLVEEVFSQQTEDTRNFLLHTSILNRMCGLLCDAVTGREDGQAMLEALQQANLFVIPLDNKRRWYRYHHLFADLLRHRLRQNFPIEGDNRRGVSELHRRASVWYEQQAAASEDHELITEAINYAFAAKDFEQATRLIAQNVELTIWKRGQINTALGWLDKLPYNVEIQWPQLCLTHALMLVWRNQFEAAEMLLQGVMGGIQSSPDQKRDDLLGQIAAIRAAAANIQGDAPGAMGFAQEALEHLSQDNLRARGLSLGILGGVYRDRGDVTLGIRAYTEATQILQAAEQRVPALIAFSYLGQLQLMRGQLNQAQQTFQQAIQLAEEWGAQKFPSLGVVYINLGKLLYERNRLDAAGRYLEQGIDLCQKWEGLGDDILEGYLAQARVYQARQNVEDALRAIQQARQLGQKQNVPHWETLVTSCHARLQLEQGDLAAVEQWVQERALSLDNAPGRYPRDIEYIMLARLRLAQGRLDEALALSAHLLETAEPAGRTGQVIESLNLQALALYQKNNLTQALIVLSQALNLAGPAGYIRAFVDEGLPMAALLRRAASQNIAPNYISKLLELFGGASLTETDSHSSTLPPQSLIEPLTQRERDVLQQMAAGRSNPEIAAELVIAVTTVKTHVKNIYGKLNVDNRFQAVARAKELNLL